MSSFGFVIEPRDNDTWRVYLPHQCDDWDIAGEDFDGGEPRQDAIDALQLFINEAAIALGHLQRGERYGKPTGP